MVRQEVREPSDFVVARAEVFVGYRNGAKLPSSRLRAVPAADAAVPALPGRRVAFAMPLHDVEGPS